MITLAPPQLIESTLDLCIKCNICTSVCPVSAVTDLFPGPKYTAPQAGRFRGPKQSTPDYSVDYCSGCRVCNLACPAGVKIAEINARARAEMVRQGKFPILLRLRNNLLARAELLGKLAHPFAPLANFILSNHWLRAMFEKFLKIHHQAPLPRFSSQKFTTWFNYQPVANGERKVVYFHGCSTQYYEPRIGRAAVRVLQANGFEVIIPPQNCCGLPLLSNGEFSAARRYHQKNVHHLVEYARQGLPIVGTSTSCTLTLKEEAPDLLDMHDEDTLLVARSTYDINEFLLNLLADGALRIDFKPIPFTLAYHAPCQYRAHRLGKPALELLKLVPELHILDSHAACCGIAGTYGYKQEKYAIAMDVGQTLFNFVRDTETSLVVCDSETCRWQITHATGKAVVHPTEILAIAYGFEPEGALLNTLSLSL